ncbi:Follistatin [Corvus brachyrhynchos]|uniref:Follistatin n=1 Tax=Corvus brachyrhynchos TaxID=85066 RepID=A0A091EB12_CORBR|nr:Follistatin [Corvus brachyrhynchos]
MLNQRIHPGMLLILMFLCHFMEDHTVQVKETFVNRNSKMWRFRKTSLTANVPNSCRLQNGLGVKLCGTKTMLLCSRETCENVDCGPGKKCKMNKKNKPRCVCAPDCSNITWKGPVCGLDGKTYRNECALLKARCKEQPELEVQYQGKCKKTCRDVLCPGSSTCVVDQTNNAYCVTCNRICPEPTSPEQYLCGNDGITYASACHLRKATCLLGRSIGLAYEGKCIKAKSCEDIQCSAGKKCLWDFKVGRGRCALCDELCPESKSEEAVCASDNTTYPSECAMKEAACSMGVLLEVKHSGSCNSINEDPEDEEEDEDQDYSFPISSILEW